MLHGACLEVKSVGKPDAVAPHVRFDERGWETGLYATAPVLDSTGWSNVSTTCEQVLVIWAHFRLVLLKTLELSLYSLIPYPK